MEVPSVLKVIELSGDEIEQSHKLLEEFVTKNSNKPLGDSMLYLQWLL